MQTRGLLGTPLRRRRWLCATTFCLIGLGLPATNQPGRAEDVPGQTTQCGQDALWEISSRRLPDCPSKDFEPNFEVTEVADGYRWPQSLQYLQNHIVEHPEQRVVFYVHGNWMPTADARARAMAVHQRLKCISQSDPICFIAFSWPSERREGFARDLIGKKTRLDADSLYFAQVIRSLQLQQPAGFIGYSFGAAILCGAQHLLGGGSLCSYRLDSLPPARLPADLSLIAPAFDRQDLTSRGKYHLAIQDHDSVFNLYNSMDPILKRFRFFDQDGSPTAAGFAGLMEPRSLQPLSEDSSIRQFDCRRIGRTHAELDYLKCALATGAFENVLGKRSEPQPAQFIAAE
jgi:hypothetical protein